MRAGPQNLCADNLDVPAWLRRIRYLNPAWIEPPAQARKKRLVDERVARATEDRDRDIAAARFGFKVSSLRLVPCCRWARFPGEAGHLTVAEPSLKPETLNPRPAAPVAAATSLCH